MNYKKDKRTKRLTLFDIHVGDWVQVWEDVTETYSSPLKVIQINDDGFVRLIGDESERDLPHVAEITDIDALPIDANLLRRFGFRVVQQPSDDSCYEDYLVSINGTEVGLLRLSTLLGSPEWYMVVSGEFDDSGRLRYMHEVLETLRRFNYFNGVLALTD